MPTYDFECSKCSRTEERTCLFAQRESQVCSCGEKMRMLFSPSSNIISDELKISFSRALGKPISGRADWKKQMRAKNFNTDALDPY